MLRLLGRGTSTLRSNLAARQLSAAAAPLRLTADERTKYVDELSNWSMVEGREAITRTFMFKDFVQSFGFMSEVALHAEKSDHHP